MLALILMMAAAEPPIYVTGRIWAPFISPMGEPFRARSTADDTMRLWFSAADTNADGRISLAEMQADADRFFARIDDNGDGKLDPDDMVRYEWDIAPDVQLGSPQRRAPGDPKPPAPRPNAPRKLNLREAPLEGAARYALLNLPQPVAAADRNFDRLVTRDEFRAAASYRFQLLDSKRSGALTFAVLDQVRAQVMAEAKKRAKRKVKPGEEEDYREGSPL